VKTAIKFPLQLIYCHPTKDLITRKLEQKTVLVLDKSEWDRITGHRQFMHKDTEYEENQMLREKLRGKSIFMVKDAENTIQVWKYMAWSCFE